ncbi:beta-glucuronidase [Hespellia stercorisuis]|uniref:Beta-glucuronidase n=1 Tax=Hespellia stercorisuis DSM 15480 TaxID=1121950 RepID=A0A1M6SXA2_9FIRM|nr:beta-glucuronidase [Hespellia stercorisuis]SHK49316.1 beta-glucuronidase [Hespellia stercorisuis DSM 15480]
MLYPILTDSRFVSDLSGVWDFKLDNGNGFEEKWFASPMKDAMTMPVPASYNDLKEGIDFRDHYGWVFYQRKISVPSIVKSQRLMLRCDAVTHEAKVYLNGALICEHKGGFLPFEVEITDKMTAGENLLTIAVSNIIDYTTLPIGGKSNIMGGMAGMGEMPSNKPANNPNFDFFNYCGLTRTVRLYTTPVNHIEDIVLTSKVNGTAADVSYHVEGTGEEPCHVVIFDKEGKKVGESDGVDGTITVQDVTLWQPLHAYLYQVQVTYGEDVYTEPYGIRTVRVDGNKFLINEKPFYFKGYGKHEDTFPNGRGINLPMNTKDISIMKWQGANSFRTSHYPYSEEMMRLCDEEGIVVIDETTAVGINLDFGGGANFNGQKVSTFDPEHGVQTQAHHKDVIRDLISRDKNHACVVLWSIANEPDSYSEGAYDYFKPLYDLARKLDPQKRPCTLVSVQMADPDKDVTRLLSDVICLNRYYGWYYGGPDLIEPEKALRAELDKWDALGKPVVFTEYGADTVMGLHDTTPVMYTEEYQVDYYKMNNQVFDDYACVAGEQTWNFADFATSQSLLRVQGNKKGMFTRDRKPKLAAHYFKERWHQIPDFDYKK